MGLSRYEELKRKRQEALSKQKTAPSLDSDETTTTTSKTTTIPKESDANRAKIREKLAKSKEDRLKKLREKISTAKSSINTESLEKEKKKLKEKLEQIETERETLEYELRLKIHHLMEEHQLSKQEGIIESYGKEATESKDITSDFQALEIENMQLKHAVLQFKQMWENLPVESQTKNAAEVEALKKELENMQEQLDHTMEAQEMVEMISQQNYELEEHKQKFEDIIEVMQDELLIADEINVMKDEAMLLVREEYEQQKVHFLKISKQVDHLKQSLEERNLEIAKMQTTIAHRDTKLKQSENEIIQKSKSLDMLKDRFAWDNSLENMTTFFDKQMLICYMQQMEKLRHHIFEFFPKSIVKKELSGVHASYLLKITELKCSLLAKTLSSQEKLHIHDFGYSSIVLNTIAFLLNSIRYSVQSVEKYHQLGSLLPTITSIQQSINSIENEFKQNFKVFTKDLQSSITNSFVSLVQQLQYFRHGMPLAFSSSGKHFLLCDTYGSLKMILDVLLQLVENTSNGMDDAVSLLEEIIRSKTKVQLDPFKSTKTSIDQLYEPIINAKQLIRKNILLFKGKHEKTIIDENIKVVIFDTLVPILIIFGHIFEKVHSLLYQLESFKKQKLKAANEALQKKVTTFETIEIKLIELDVKTHPLIGSMGSFLSYVCNLTHGMCEEVSNSFVKPTLIQTLLHLNQKIDSLNDSILKKEATFKSTEKFMDGPRESRARMIQEAFESINPMQSSLKSAKLEISQLKANIKNLEIENSNVQDEFLSLQHEHVQSKRRIQELEGYEHQIKSMKPILLEKEELSKKVASLQSTVASLQHEIQLKSSVSNIETPTLDVKGKELLEEQILHMSRTILTLDQQKVEQKNERIAKQFHALLEDWKKEDTIKRQWQEKLQIASQTKTLFSTPNQIIRVNPQAYLTTSSNANNIWRHLKTSLDK